MMHSQFNQVNNTSLQNEEPSSSRNTDAFDLNPLRNCLPNTNHQSDNAEHIPDQLKAAAEKRLMAMNNVLVGMYEVSSSTQMQPSLANAHISEVSSSLDGPSTSQATEVITFSNRGVSSRQSEFIRRSELIRQIMLARVKDRQNKLDCCRKLPPNKERSTSTKNTDVFDLKNLKNSLPTTNHQSIKDSHGFQNMERSKIQKLIKVQKALSNSAHESLRSNHVGALLKRKNHFPKSFHLCDPSTSRATAESNVSNRAVSTSQTICKLIAVHNRKFLADIERLENIFSSEHVTDRGVSRPQKNLVQEQSRLQNLFTLLRTKAKIKRLAFLRQLSESRLDKVEERLQPQQNIRAVSVAALTKVVEENQKLEKEIAETTKIIQMMEAKKQAEEMKMQ